MTLKVRVLLMAIVMMFSVFSIADASNNNRVFEGCWSASPGGQCRAIYRDAKGNYFICGDCDSSGNPGSGNCSRISQATLAQGYWCS